MKHVHTVGTSDAIVFELSAMNTKPECGSSRVIHDANRGTMFVGCTYTVQIMRVVILEHMRSRFRYARVASILQQVTANDGTTCVVEASYVGYIGAHCVDCGGSVVPMVSVAFGLQPPCRLRAQLNKTRRSRGSWFYARTYHSTPYRTQTSCCRRRRNIQAKSHI